MALVDNVRVRNTADGAEPELHLVPRKRAGLVAEHVLDLTQLFDERRDPAQRRSVRLCVVHVQIRVDQLRLLELDNLHRHDERDRNKVVI